MKHQVFGKKLKRDTKRRKALFRGLISSLVLKGRIKTTEAKAKAVKGQADKVVSLAKKGTLATRRRLLACLDKNAVDKLMNELGPSLSGRASGFTQIVKIGPRKGDNAPMVLLQWVGQEAVQRKEEKKLEAKESKKTQPGEKMQKSKKNSRRAKNDKTD